MAERRSLSWQRCFSPVNFAATGSSEEGRREKVALVEFPDLEGGNAFGWRDSLFGSFLGCWRDFSCDQSATAFTSYSLPHVLVSGKAEFHPVWTGSF